MFPDSDLIQSILILQEQMNMCRIDSAVLQTSAGNSAIEKADEEIDTTESLLQLLNLSDSESFAGSDVSDIEDTIEDLRIHIDCLFELLPAFENPAKDPKRESMVAEKSIVLVPRTFSAKIISKYPFLDKQFAIRLSEANWKRRGRLSKNLMAPISSVSKSGGGNNYAIRSPERSSIETKTNAIKLSVPSTNLETASANDEDLYFEETPQQLPQLPIYHKWGSVFKCFICNENLRDIKDADRWR